MAFWSIAVICPAFARGMDGRWPRWVTRIGSQTSRRGLRPKGFPGVFRSSVRPIAILLLSLQAPGQNALSALLGRKRPAIKLTAHHHGPERPSHLVGQRDCRKLLRLARYQVEQPGRPVARLGEADQRCRAKHDQFAQSFVALPADAPLPASATGGIVLRGKAEPR